MKNHLSSFLFLFILSITIIGCNQVNNVPVIANEVEVPKVDSLAIQLHKLDSIYNSGNLVHIDIYKLGKLKSIEFSVQSIDSEEAVIQFINLRKDCGNEYYYSWEDARLLPSECKYLMNAIESVKKNLNRTTDHEERYAYITKDDIRLFAFNDGGGSKWKIALSVDYRKERSEVILNEEELKQFVRLVNTGLDKIEQIKK